MTTRDMQKSRVYAADKVLVKVAKPLATVTDVEKYVARLFKSKRFAKKYPRAAANNPPRVADGRGTRIAKGGMWHINIPVWARNEAVVLHEIAHTVTMREYYRDSIQAHGWQYAAIYLDLVKWMMGAAAHKVLKSAFKANKVRFRKPVKREFTPEQRQALADRLLAYRLQKKATAPTVPVRIKLRASA